ncbi:Acyl-CoA dehydrogenase, N-terminal domain [Parafrankia irregularis]|uniref:Acyl-CoA dehydrogenase, N-terminal domain n=1 Tax=Parafrankia irregularis TaxID=795642 RepID=A0A0S4QUJ4_9ACTN|nr:MULTISPECIES: acyl-CoA dehydrogenase [Parafrankia]MBE3199989.1 acyl-CoA dehydrogenase family protein [Parafrankia sp. CH37]CUU59265.1 Acyl-CoA dehydrogenase, N-terminal domain [Parafrankia irregularis]
MQFRLDDDQLAMRDAVRAFCADHFSLDDLAAREGKPTDATLWSALAELGILGLLLDDAAPGSEAGSGLGLVEAAIAFEQLGAHLAGGPVLWSTLAAPFVDGAAEGTVRVAGVTIDGSAAGSTTGPLVVEHGDECDVLLVAYDDRLDVCPRAEVAASVTGAPLDPLTPVAVLPDVPAGRVVGGAPEAGRLRLRGEILSAAALVGVAQGALDVARDYALEREQFGVAIGSFQAIKHMLADMYVRVELARASAYAAAAVATDPRAGDPRRAASAAKLLAGEAGIANGRAAVQVLGGMGFTWDMLPHYFLKRAWVLENQFGTVSSHAARLGTAVGSEVAAS